MDSILNRHVVATFEQSGEVVHVRGLVTEEYVAELHGFKLPMVVLRCTDGRKRYVLRSGVVRTYATISAREAVAGTAIVVDSEWQHIVDRLPVDSSWGSGYGERVYHSVRQIVVGRWEAAGHGQAYLYDNEGHCMGMYPAEERFRAA